MTPLLDLDDLPIDLDDLPTDVDDLPIDVDEPPIDVDTLPPRRRGAAPRQGARSFHRQPIPPHRNCRSSEQAHRCRILDTPLAVEV